MTDKSSTAPGPPDLELVLASILGGVIVLSADDRITFLNPAAEAVLQRSAAVLIGKGATELYPLLPWIEPLVARLKTEPATTVRGEGSIAEGHGEAVAVVAPLRDRVGQPDGTVVVLHDLGARQLLYDDDLARARLEELDGVVSRIAHELNNPLAGIRGAAQMLEGKLSDRPELGKYSSMIVRQVDRLSQLIHGLLMLETPAPAMEPLNIHRVLNDVILLAQTEARGRNVEIATAFDPSLPEVRGNQDQLQQLFLNLLKNAVAACPESRGRITVTTRMENRFYVETASERVRYLLVDVEDNGPGLDEETRHRMFTPFFSRREGGTGLGLSIAYNIATAHKGRIHAENSDNGGARLRVQLPVTETRRTAARGDAS